MLSPYLLKLRLKFGCLSCLWCGFFTGKIYLIIFHTQTLTLSDVIIASNAEALEALFRKVLTQTR